MAVSQNQLDRRSGNKAGRRVMVDMGFIEKIFDQTFSNHPYLFLFIVLVAGSALTHSYSVFAQKASVAETFQEYAKSTDDKFADLEKKIDNNNAIFLDLFSRQAIRNYTSEIHSLTELDRAGRANQRDRKRLGELKRNLKTEQDTMRNRKHEGEL